MNYKNPFALVKASDYTDQQINDLWVEIGQPAINAIIEPQARSSKVILGGKGTGKTHLLRYFSYPVIRLRKPKSSGTSILNQQKFLAIFLRAAGLDSARFEMAADFFQKGQQLFGIYFELKLVEALLHALCDIKLSSKNDKFDDHAFIKAISASITADSFDKIKTVEDFHEWVLEQRKQIDSAVNNAAFSGKLDINVPFSIGAICIPISKALQVWHPVFSEVPLIYLIDEIENLTTSQQEVLNTLIRYGESNATFRVSGRLYGLRTTKTIGGGEENREGSEFKTVILDDVLRAHDKFPDFAKKFIRKRLASVGQLDLSDKNSDSDPNSFFEEIDTKNYFSEAIAKLGFNNKGPSSFKQFKNALKATETKDIDLVFDNLTSNFPLLLQKLNLLVFCKKYKKSTSAQTLSNSIKEQARSFINGENVPSYNTAYNHYALDLFAQLCKESPKEINFPYAGLDTFIKMSSGNPRNLLLILGQAYSMASFRDLDFIKGPKLSISLQTEAAIEAAKFMFEVETNLGPESDAARLAIDRLAILLRTARYALNIPEVSPLAVSFSEDDLSSASKNTLQTCLTYSFLFEVKGGRPARNSPKVNRKYQLNPMLSPKWRLPVSRRGDLGLRADIVNAIFDPAEGKAFEHTLRNLHLKWNNPFRKKTIKVLHQESLFDL